MNNLTDKFLDWIFPLLYFPEREILLQTRVSNYGVRLKDYNTRKVLQKKYKLTRRTIYNILWRLEWLTRLYELQVAAGLHDTTLPYLQA